MAGKKEAYFRHAAYYANVLLQAEQIYLLGSDRVTASLGQFDREWANIQIAQEWSARLMDVDERAAQLCCEFPERGANCLFLRQTPEQRIAWLNSALRSAQKLSYGMVVANIFGKLGLAYADLGAFDQAVQLLTLRIQMARRFNDLEGEGEGLGNLGIVYDQMGKSEEAIPYFLQALEIAQKREDQRVEGSLMGNLGYAYSLLHDDETALKYHQQHLTMARQTGDRRGESNALTNIGNINRARGQPAEAVSYHSQSLAISRSLNEPAAIAQDLGNLGLDYVCLENFPSAEACFMERIGLAVQNNDLAGAARGEWNLGELYARQGRLVEAVEHMQRCLDWEISVGHPDMDADETVINQLRKQLAGGQEIDDAEPV